MGLKARDKYINVYPQNPSVDFLLKENQTWKRGDRLGDTHVTNYIRVRPSAGGIVISKTEYIYI